MRYTDYQQYLKDRNKAIMMDFRKLKMHYATLGLLYEEIAKRNNVSVATVRRVLDMNRAGGVQNFKPLKNVIN